MNHAAAVLASIAGACAATTAPTVPPAADTLPGGEPMLRMPFRAGVVALCQQGNATGSGHSHSKPNTMHALDLSTPGADGTEIVASAPGRVSHVITGAVAGGVTPGGGFGNHVVIDHGSGYATMYAHLKTVAVKEGDAVAAGQLIGVMGDTGKAGNTHLHFSLHHTAFGADGAPPTAVIHGLVTADATNDGDFGLRTSLELVCAGSVVSSAGHLYASENAGGVPLFGAAPAAMAATIAKARDDRSAAIGDVHRVDDALARLTAGGSPAAVRQELRTIRADADYPIALYWIAVVSLRDLDDWDAARAAIAELAELHSATPWLGPWTVVRAAQIADHDGRTAEARELWAKAKAESYRDAEYTKLVDAAQNDGGDPGPSR